MEELILDFDRILNLTKGLTPVQKIKLIKCLSNDIENSLESQKAAKITLKGLFKGCSINSDDIADIRKEMWKNFSTDTF